MREMKRASSILIACGVAAAGWAMLGAPDTATPPQAAQESLPAATQVVQIVPAATPAAAAPPAATPEPTPEGTVTFDPGSEVVVPVAFSLPPQEPGTEPGDVTGEAGMVAGADYDFSQPVPQSGPVEDDYFADALFVGDSRTDGFRMFSGLDRGDYIVKTGLSVFKIETEHVKVDGKKMTVAKALERKDYGKVYVCLGLNELGMRDDQGYYDHYAQFVDVIRAQQPEATIYVQLLIPVNEKKCAEKGVADYINNEQIGVYNALLHRLGQEKRVFLVDPAQALVDETGEPPYDSVGDGVHFQKEPYRRWLDYLRQHTVDKGEWE